MSFLEVYREWLVCEMGDPIKSISLVSSVHRRFIFMVRSLLTSSFSFSSPMCLRVICVAQPIGMSLWL